MEEKKKSILAQWCNEIKEGLKEGYSLKSHEAFSLCHTGKIKTQAELQEAFTKNVFEEIRYKAERRAQYHLIEYPEYLNQTKLKQVLEELGYNIVYEDMRILVITWQYY